MPSRLCPYFFSLSLSPTPTLTFTLIVALTSQWLAGGSPDPENVHFKGIVDAVSALQSRLWMEDDPKADAPFYVWLDYISIPQANKTLQSLSISSLALYAR